MPDHYKTRPKQMVLEYLRHHQGEPVSAQDIFLSIRQQGPIGLTTIYRRLDDLVRSGEVVRHTGDGGSACYEYRADPDLSDRFCFKCERCGSLSFTSCAELDALRRHLLSDHNFWFDARRTVFYGLCEQCRSQEG